MEAINKNFHVTDVNMTTENKVVLLKATYLLAAGNLYVVTYRIYPSGIVNVSAQFLLRICSSRNRSFRSYAYGYLYSRKRCCPQSSFSKLEVPRIGVRSVCPPK